MSHKILIELDEQTEAELRTIAEHNRVSLSEAARGIVSRQCKQIRCYMDLREQFKKHGEAIWQTQAGEQK